MISVPLLTARFFRYRMQTSEPIYDVMTNKRKEETHPLKLVFLPSWFQPCRPATAKPPGCTLKIMIRLNALDCKLKNTILHIRNLYRQCLDQNPLFLKTCPYCGAKGTCRKRGSHERSLVAFHDGKPEVLRLRVPRVQCPCGKSHALLPDFIVPYLSYSLPMILQVLCDYFNRHLTVHGICQKYLITPPVIYRFKKQFLLHKKEWLGIVRDMSLPACDFLEETLAGSYSQFHDAFLRLTTYSFLQSHKNPANCERPRFGSADSHPFCHGL